MDIQEKSTARISLVSMVYIAFFILVGYLLGCTITKLQQGQVYQKPTVENVSPMVKGAIDHALNTATKADARSHWNEETLKRCGCQMVTEENYR